MFRWTKKQQKRKAHHTGKWERERLHISSFDYFSRPLASFPLLCHFPSSINCSFQVSKHTIKPCKSMGFSHKFPSIKS